MPPSVGDRLGPYEILAPIGKGGMGEVYRARDTKLKREVAIKVLPETFARDPERMARFQREAEVLASLNHPNIAAIYGVEERALVMELVEGSSPKGPLSFDEAWKIASQIASALEYAHDKGIMHRDLKPANIMVTPEGLVKLLDFGLAKAFTNQRESASASAENSPTLTLGATEVGMILGTAAYMAPEQARGKAVDKRADIWSFGVVLHELLTGERLFSGDDAAETLAAVIHKQPDLAKAPRQARRLLEECLQKDPKQRLRDIGDAKKFVGAEVTAVQPSRSRVWWVPWTISVMAVVGSVFALRVHESPSLEQMARFEVPAPAKTSGGTFELSPDGRYLAIAANDAGVSRLYIRPIDSLEAQVLPGTEGASYPIWSPDSTFIGFFAQGKLKKVALTGGSPQILCDVVEGHGGSWNRDGVILFTPSARSALQKVSASGGIPAAVTKLASAGDSHRYPAFLPDGRHFLYLLNTDKPETTGIYGGSLDGSLPVRLLSDPSKAMYAPAAGSGQGGYLLFRRGTTLMAQPFDPGSLRMTGEMFPLAQDVANAGNTFFSAFSVSAHGELTYRVGVGAVTLAGNLVWLDRAGKQLGTIAAPGPVGEFSLSPDGKRVAVVVAAGVSRDVWLGDVDRGTMSRFTFGPASAFMPVWSPDDSRIAFTARDPHVSRYAVYQKPSSGSGQQQLLLQTAAANVWAYDWSRDGKFIVYAQDAEQTKRDLWLLPLEGDHKPVPYLQTPFTETNGQFSPDGRWMAYASDETGQSQVYVQAIPSAGAKYQVSTAGALCPDGGPTARSCFTSRLTRN
jgi:serine/threonine protein kinase